EMDATPIGLYEPGDHVEHRSLSGAIGPEQTDRLAATDKQAYPAHHFATRIVFFDAAHRKIVAVLLAMLAAGAGCAPLLTRGGSRWCDLCIGTPHPSSTIAGPDPSLPCLRGRVREDSRNNRRSLTPSLPRWGKVRLGPSVCGGFWSPHSEAFDETEQI